MGSDYECSADGRVRHAMSLRLRKIEVSPRADDPHSYVRLVPVPGGKERRLGLRNVVAACWLPGVHEQGLRLDGQGRVEQDACRVVHLDGDPRNNNASNLKIVPGAVARKRRREGAAWDVGEVPVPPAAAVPTIGPQAPRNSPAAVVLTWVSGFDSRGAEMARRDR